MADLDILKRIESILNTEFIQSPEPEYTGASYTLDQSGQVTGVILYGFNNMDLKQIVPQLKKLDGLKRLNVADNWLRDEDLAPLKELRGLKELDLSSNPIDDISVLPQIKNLTGLNLSLTNFSDTTRLAELKNLTSLSLHGNNINDVAPLTGLKDLVRLNLSLNRIGDIYPLVHLKQLTTLDLGKNLISNITPLAKLKNLEVLDLYHNSIADVLPISKLEKLFQLNLDSTHVFDINPLARLQYLYKLNLANTNVDDIGPIALLSKLTELNLRFAKADYIARLSQLNKLGKLDLSLGSDLEITSLVKLKNVAEIRLFSSWLTDIASLCKVHNLTGLYLVRFEGDIAPIAQSNQLKELYISSAKIGDLTPVARLQNLEELYILSTSIRDITPLAQLKNLKTLDLRFNEVSDIAQLSQLKKLTYVDLGYNSISDLTPLAHLENLTELQLSANKISSITPLAQLKKLTRLNLSANKISSIADVSGLPYLRSLHLRRNLISWIDSISPLKRLREVDLSENKITFLSRNHLSFKTILYADFSANRLQAVPFEYFLFFYTRYARAIVLQQEYLRSDSRKKTGPKAFIDKMIRSVNHRYVPGIEYLFLVENPLVSPPLEIVSQGREAIENYFKQLREGEDYLFEAKLLILGEPGAGKTSMAWKLENAACTLPNEDDTTRGVEVKQYYFPIQPENFPMFRHPEKLANKNFRLNLWDFGGQEIYKATHRFFLSKSALYALVADSRNEDTDFNYWLHIVEMFGGNSPLLIILNEKHGRRRNLDVSAMQNRFGNIVEVIDVDFNEADNTRLGKLKNAVRYHVAQLPHVGSTVPAKWTAVREALEQDPRNTISLQDYLALCRDHGIEETKSALVLSQYFHDIGVFLHFQDDQLLKKTIFLKPNWATGSAYKVLDHELLNAQHGRFSRADAEIIWQEDNYTLLRDELLRLMQRFFLTYEVGNSGQYVVPERLPNAQPPYAWEPKDNLYLRYDYEQFMPKGIMSQFIVQMHRYITDQDLVWRRGVVLERERTRAEIIETYDARTIKIRVTGPNKRDFLTVIAEQLDGINGQYEKMKPNKLIPCNCYTCKREEQPHFYPHKDLRTRLERGKREVECGKSYEMVNVQSLMDEVINADLRYSGKQENNPEPSSTMNAKIERDQVFVSYSHKDKDMLQVVQTHLKVLENEGIPIKLWDDTRIKAGTKWREEIEKALSAARVAVLLVSTDFLASDFITKTELPALLKAAESEGAVVLSLILKPCRFTKNKELSVFQSVNDPAKPLSGLSKHDREEELLKLADRIGELMSRKDS